MGKFRYYISALFCITWAINANATHNRAGEITYKWLYGYTYEIKVTTYTNIDGTNLADRCEDTVYFGDGTRASILRSNGPIGSCSPAHEGVPLSTKIKLNEYITTHTYPGPGSYLISMEDPNRNVGVNNIPNSINQPFYIESFLNIPSFGSGKNNSPILTYPPIDNGCVGHCFYHNPGAYDLDGDSLSYELTTCKGAGGVTCPGYSYPGSGVGGVYRIDSVGTLTWCNPQTQDLFNLAFIIKEWRLNDDGDYFMVGYVERDMQIVIGNCNNNNNPHIIFTNLDTCIVAGASLNRTLMANDIDADNITLFATGAPFAFATNAATFNSTSGNSASSGSFHLNSDYSHVQRLPYQITSKVIDNNPVVALVHFKTFNIKIIPEAPFNLSSSVPASDHVLLNWNKPASYLLNTKNKFERYKVYRKDGLSNWVHSSTETVPPAYTGFVLLGANTNVNDTLFIDYNNAIPFISGQDYSYVVLAEYSDGATSYVSNTASSQVFVGINEVTLNNSSVAISPNPINDYFTLSFNLTNAGAFTIELVDVTGRNIKTYLENESIAKQQSIPLKSENITPGIYFLKITDSFHTTITKKIIKQ
ncbi:MAG: T9SS type A sorting domain-containing protein [Bacteroidetes bacterium]|nr:T9SS type A sorting domain-containing protein [Bacteroidota bacterium]